MTAILLPPARVAARLPAVRAAALLVLAGPVFVAWVGAEADAPVRLRIAGLVLAAALAMLWDDRCAVVTAPTPVGLPAVRRGRSAVVFGLLALAWVLSHAAVGGQHVPYAALTLQTVALGALLVALVGWYARDRQGEPLLTMPFPALLVTLVVLSRLPADLALLRTAPGDAGWPAERARWFFLLVLAVLCAVRLGRDPGARRSRPPLYGNDRLRRTS